MNDGGIVYYVDPDDGNLYVRDDFVPVKSSADILQISIELENRAKNIFDSILL